MIHRNMCTLYCLKVKLLIVSLVMCMQCGCPNIQAHNSDQRSSQSYVFMILTIYHLGMGMYSIKKITNFKDFQIPNFTFQGLSRPCILVSKFKDPKNPTSHTQLTTWSMLFNLIFNTHLHGNTISFEDK